MLHMEDRHWKIVHDILLKYSYTFCAFGSRVQGNPRPLSDLDLCFFEDIPDNVLSHIKEDFEESRLPYEVDIIDWNACDPTFQSIIEKDLFLIQGDLELLSKSIKKSDHNL